jgi:predicted nuclease with TOPRIM domain
MSEDVLKLLQAIRRDIANMLRDIADLQAESQESRERVGLLEERYASVSRRLDRRASEIEVIKDRLNPKGDLVDHSNP